MYRHLFPKYRNAQSQTVHEGTGKKVQGGGGGEAFQNVVVRLNMIHPFHLAQN